ncbi:MAG: winged helix-turn-helix domain-containing protein [Nanoarchaeota archaeon]
MVEKYIELNLNDEKSGKIAEILSNKTAKKILGLLAEKELSQGDIAKELKIQLNTIDYNIKKLVDSGLIEKTSNFFWSVKGKKIPTYKLANKRIIISTKNSFRGLTLSAIIGGAMFGLGKFGFNIFNTDNALQIAEKVSDVAYASEVSLTAPAAGNVAQTTSYFGEVSIWIIVGLFAGSLAFILYRKIRQMKGGMKI